VWGPSFGLENPLPPTRMRTAHLASRSCVAPRSHPQGLTSGRSHAAVAPGRTPRAMGRVACTNEAGAPPHATAARQSTGAPLHVCTPLLYSNPLSAGLGYDVWLKMDALQPSGTLRLQRGHATTLSGGYSLLPRLSCNPEWGACSSKASSSTAAAVGSCAPPSVGRALAAGAGSFKLRGIGLTCQRAVEGGATTLVSSSGGNAGMAVAYCGRALAVPTVVVGAFPAQLSPLQQRVARTCVWRADTHRVTA